MGRRYYRRYGYRRGRSGTAFMVMLCIIFWPLIPIVLIVYFIKWLLRRQNDTLIYKTNDSEITYKRNQMDAHELPYTKKASQITQAEMNFYKVLEQAVAGRFDIQRQVLLSTLVDTTSRDFKDSSTGLYYNPDRSRINRRTIDFVLYNKEDLSPYLAIELDDSSHNNEDRIERDRFVEDVLAGTGIRLVRVKNAYSYNLQTLDMILNL